jgi:carboxyl-terminal processing protease
MTSRLAMTRLRILPLTMAITIATALTIGSAGVAHAETDADVLAQVDRIVRAKFYAPEVMRERGWDASVAAARAAWAGASPARRHELLAELVATLRTSHTEYFAPDSPRHAQLLAIFESNLVTNKDACPDPAKVLPMPIEVPDAGVWWQRIEGRWYVGGVLDDGPARSAGLLLGDEVVTADGKPFQPVAAFAAGPDRTVRLGVRRSKGGKLRTLSLRPRRVSPQAAFRAALGASARIVERGRHRVAYVHVWSWTGDVMQEALEDAIARLNEQKPTAFVVDIRDGWGGASPDFVRIFDKDVPLLSVTTRDGAVHARDAHIRVPAVLLTNRGSKSGKEIIAYAVKKHGLARIVGEPTGGAVLPGGPFCLDNGAVLYLARSRLTVDGEVLEGKGVAPDVAVPFDLRHAAGRDRQLEAAIDVVTGAR